MTCHSLSLPPDLHVAAACLLIKIAARVWGKAVKTYTQNTFPHSLALTFQSSFALLIIRAEIVPFVMYKRRGPEALVSPWLTAGRLLLLRASFLIPIIHHIWHRNLLCSLALKRKGVALHRTAATSVPKIDEREQSTSISPTEVHRTTTAAEQLKRGTGRWERWKLHISVVLVLGIL